LYEGSGSQPTAIALYYSSTAVGSALGFVVGGTVGGYWGWRYAFFAAGPPGVFLSLLFLVSVETDSANSRRATLKHQSRPSGLIADVATLLKISSYVYATFGFASLTFAISGLAAFMPIYLSRTTNVAESVASTAFGAVACVSGVVGPFTGNAIAKILLKKRANGYLHICFAGLALSVPFGVASVLIPFFDLPFSVLLCYASSFVAQTFFFSIMSPNLVMSARGCCCIVHANSSLTFAVGHSVQCCS
jgi:MFS family permease